MSPLSLPPKDTGSVNSNCGNRRGRIREAAVDARANRSWISQISIFRKLTMREAGSPAIAETGYLASPSNTLSVSSSPSSRVGCSARWGSRRLYRGENSPWALTDEWTSAHRQHLGSPNSLPAGGRGTRTTLSRRCERGHHGIFGPHLEALHLVLSEGPGRRWATMEFDTIPGGRAHSTICRPASSMSSSESPSRDNGVAPYRLSHAIRLCCSTVSRCAHTSRETPGEGS